MLGELPGYRYTPASVKGFHTRFMYYIEHGCTAELYIAPTVIGRYKDEWLFEGYGVNTRGLPVVKEQNAIGYNLDDKAYLDPAEYIDKNNRYLQMALPLDDKEITAEKVQEIVASMLKNYGGIIGLFGIGWTLGCYMKNIVQEDLKWGYPVCYITGNAESREINSST